MKKAIFGLLLSLISFSVFGQKIYFIYFQTENKQPFFVRMDEKVYNSNASGYLTLSKLIDSTYNYEIGFPEKDISLAFTTVMNKKDHGYLVKNFGDKGWGLFDLQTLEVQMPPNKKTAADENRVPDSSVNAFTALLSKAADDPSLKYSPVVITEEKKIEPIRPLVIETKSPADTKTSTVTETIPSGVTESKNPAVTETKTSTSTDNKTPAVTESKNPVAIEAKKDSLPAQSIAENKREDVKAVEQKSEQKPSQEKQPGEKLTEEKKAPAVKETAYKKSEVTKIGENNVADGVEIVFADKQVDKTDTIRIVVDNNKVAEAKPEIKTEETKPAKKFLDISTDSVKVSSDTVRAETKTQSNKQDQSSVENKVDTAKASADPSILKKINLKKVWPFNKDKATAGAVAKCEVVADDNDFLKLRRKMAGRTNDDGMIEEANKYFKTKCFTTEQIRNLSSMFLSNAGKLNFFEAAYPSTSDKQNFPSLQSELKDEFYINRFKAIVQK